ncbi:MAG TPA: hypothetical protein VHR45_07495 [Thermoanaerobaculia bacterium]|nr:hypothetical protein [Thermoanaerobaculia bacterium]
MVALCCVSTPARNPGTRADDSSPDASSPDAGVLHAVLAAFDPSASDQYLVVAAEAFPPLIERDWVVQRLHEMGKVDPGQSLDEMIADYKIRNAKSHVRSMTSAGSVKVKFVDEQELKRVFADGALQGWQRFWQEFPGAAALVELTLPGYSHYRSRAIACSFVSRGSLAGVVYVVLLHWDAGAWVVEWSDILVET